MNTFQNDKTRDRFYQNMTPEQKSLFHSIKENIFTFCEAKAGTGKTATSVAACLDLYANKEVDRIIYIQKVSQRFLQNGLLPGTIEEKTENLFLPFHDAMAKLGYKIADYGLLIAQGKIVLTTDSTLRGVNFERAAIIVDEGENCDTETLKLIFTRCHDNCHVVLLGDRLQKDNKGSRQEDFVRYGEYMSAHIGKTVYLTKNFRGKFSRLAEDF